MFPIIVTGVNTRLIQNKTVSVCSSILAYFSFDKNALKLVYNMVVMFNIELYPIVDE
jgi:hypothetical protein